MDVVQIFGVLVVGLVILLGLVVGGVELYWKILEWGILKQLEEDDEEK